MFEGKKQAAPATVGQDMARQSAIASLLRSHRTQSFWRKEPTRDGKTLWIQADLPVGRGWNRDGEPLEWRNIAGWITDDEYQAMKKSEEAEQKREDAKGKKVNV